MCGRSCSLRSRSFYFIAAVICLLFAASIKAQAQKTESYEADRKRAFQLYDDHNLIEALPLLEKLATQNPSDAVLFERLSFALVGNAATVSDAETRKQMRARARKLALRSKELGNNSDFLQIIIDSLPPDGSEPTFSKRKDVDEAMREGEAAFVKGDDYNALAAYRRALTFDPDNYEATLFIGDVYFKKGDMIKAADWFGRAAQINPDRETAHRYFGDALMKLSEFTQARAKYIDAIIAEPYNRKSWVGLIQWGQARQVRLSQPLITPPDSMTVEKGKVNITVDPKTLESKDGSQHWLLYSLTRATWPAGRFAKEYPNEKEYRHSMREEAEALRALAEAVAKDVKEGKIKTVEPQLLGLMKLNDSGLLEAYILFARADEGISKDYEAYRKANRDKLRRYLSEYVAPEKQ